MSTYPTIKSYRFFDYFGTAIHPYVSDMNNIKWTFEMNSMARPIKRIEVYERKENESIWEEKYVETYRREDFK